jgi:hypothetical protein
MQDIWSGVLTSFAGPITCAASDGGPPGRDQVGHDAGEMLDTLVEFEIEGIVHVVGGDARVEGQALPPGHEQVRVFVLGEHHRHGTLDVGQTGVQQRPAHAGRINDIAVAEQDEGTDALVLHGRPQRGADIAIHPGHVGQFRNVGARSHSRSFESRHRPVRPPGSS